MRRPRFRPPQGPAQRAAKAASDLGFMQAHAGGFSPNQLFDAQVRARQAQQAFERAQKQASGGPDFFDRAGAALMSSRFSLGSGGAGGGSPFGQLMPLVGRTLAIFGKFNPIVGGLAVQFTALAASTNTLFRVIGGAAQTAGAMGSAGLLSGGSPQTIGALTSLGIPAGQVADLAAALRQRRATDPFAMMAGGFQLPRPFGGADEAQGLKEKIEELRVTRQLHGAEAQLIQARMLGLESILPLINTSKRIQDAQAAGAKLSSEIFDPKFTQDALDFNAAQRRVDDSWKRLEGAMAKPFIDAATTALLKFAGAIDRVADAANKHPHAVEAGAGVPAMAFGGPQGQIFGGAALARWLAELVTGKQLNPGGVAGGADPQTQATQDNTEAVQKLNALLIMMIHGGGPRARGAIPPAILSFGNRQAMLDARLDLRGFRF